MWKITKTVVFINNLSVLCNLFVQQFPFLFTSSDTDLMLVKTKIQQRQNICKPMSCNLSLDIFVVCAFKQLQHRKKPQRQFSITCQSWNPTCFPSVNVPHRPLNIANSNPKSGFLTQSTFTSHFKKLLLNLLHFLQYDRPVVCFTTT